MGREDVRWEEEVRRKGRVREKEGGRKDNRKEGMLPKFVGSGQEFVAADRFPHFSSPVWKMSKGWLVDSGELAMLNESLQQSLDTAGHRPTVSKEITKVA